MFGYKDREEEDYVQKDEFVSLLRMKIKWIGKAGNYFIVDLARGVRAGDEQYMLFVSIELYVQYSVETYTNNIYH